MVLRKVPAEEWPQLLLKVTAADAINGRRQDWGIKRKWEGDYLSLSSENDNSVTYLASVRQLKQKDQFQKVLFSAYVKKVNKHNKCADRALLITDTHLYKLDQKGFKPLKSAIAFSKLTGVSVTPGPDDQLVVLHLSEGNDLVVALTSHRQENRVGELVGIVVRQWRVSQKKDLKVIVNSQLQCVLGKKPRTLSVEASPSAAFPTFRKSGAQLVLVWPQNQSG